MTDFNIDNIEAAVKDFAEGKFVIVVDDEDRENEGDLIIAAAREGELHAQACPRRALCPHHHQPL